MQIDFMTVSSYGAGTVSSGSVKLKKVTRCDIYTFRDEME
jgi:hypoxanthine-guanine phosphoribosyltransferase